MNLSHVITEFSFGPYFPDITQPLDDSFEMTQERTSRQQPCSQLRTTDPSVLDFTAFQYYLHVVPTTYIAPRSHPLQTNQYSVTHYTRTFQHGQGTPGIFFKFDLDPMTITIHQKTSSFIQLMIRYACSPILSYIKKTFSHARVRYQLCRCDWRSFRLYGIRYSYYHTRGRSRFGSRSNAGYCCC